MKLTRVGKLGLNSPARALIQRHAVAAILERLGGRVEGGTVLELGCGRGVGVEIILDRFRAARVDAIDIDPDMITLARRRLARRPQAHVSLGDATAIDAPDESFDAVFDFGAIHQMPNWPAALVEVRRVLRPGARFFFEEVASRLHRSTFRFTVEGWPAPGARPFSRSGFLAELHMHGLRRLRLGDPRLVYVLAAVSSGLVGDTVGVAERTATDR